MKQSLDQLRLLFLALLIGQVLFFVVTFFLIKDKEAANSIPSLEGIVPAVLLGAAGAGFLLYRQRLNQVPSLKDRKAKFEHYRVSTLLRLALLEGANLLAIVAALVETEPAYFYFFTAGILIFVTFRPTPDKFSRDYQVSLSDLQKDT